MSILAPLLAASAANGSGSVLVLVCFALVLAYAVWAARGHFQSQGGCCGGGGSAPPPPDKEIGRVIARRELVIDGLHCMNCVAHAKKALDAIPGVSADVTLDPPRAFVRMDRDVPDAALCGAIEREGYRVVSITRTQGG